MIIAARPGETAGCLISGVVPLSSRSSTPSALMYSLPYNIAITFIRRRCTHWHKTAETCVLYYILLYTGPSLYQCVARLGGGGGVVVLSSYIFKVSISAARVLFSSFYIFSTDASSSSCCCYPSAVVVALFLCVSLPERLYTRYDYTRTRHLKTMIYSLGVLITGQVSSAATGSSSSSSPSFPALYLIVVRERRATAPKERTRIVVVG